MTELINGFPNPKEGYYKVYVRSITYNQSSFIKDCLNGVAAQQTDFPFIHHVIDDSSSDGEQEVIKTWMESECDIRCAKYYDNDICFIIVAKHKKNVNYTIAAYLLKKNLFGNPIKEELFNLWRNKCKYEAICEGDDYWIYSMKLQRQVDFLDLNPYYGLCYTNCKRKNEAKKTFEEGVGTEKDLNLTTLLHGNNVAALTTLCRISILYQYYKEICPTEKKWLMGDYPKWLYFAEVSKIKRLVECTACYRIVEGTTSRPKSIYKILEYIDSTYSVKFFFLKRHHEVKIKKNDMIAEKYYRRASVYFQHNMLMYAYQECKKCPFNLFQFTKRLVKIVLKRP